MLESILASSSDLQGSSSLLFGDTRALVRGCQVMSIGIADEAIRYEQANKVYRRSQIAVVFA